MKTLKTATLAAALLVLVSCGGSGERQEHLMKDALAKVSPEVFQPGKNYFFYPGYSDREGWETLFGSDCRKLITKGEEDLSYEWRNVSASAYLEFQRSGSRDIMQAPDFANKRVLKELVFAELAEGKGRFIDKIIDGMWYYSERASWLMSAHQVRQHSKRALPDFRDVIMDLGSQTTGETYAFALHMFREQFDAIDPALAITFDEALERNLFRPYMDPKNRAAQSWLGYPAPETGKVEWWESWDPRNNWNVWSNSAVAYAALMACRDRDELLAILNQTADSIDNWLNFITKDGACDEGGAYWGHAAGRLGFYLELMNEATDGAFGCWDNERFRNMFTYISRIGVSDEVRVNFSDCGPTLSSALMPYTIGVEGDMKELRDYAIFLNAANLGYGKFDRLPSTGTPHEMLIAYRLAPDFRKDARKALSDARGDFDRMKKSLVAEIPAVNWYPETEHFLAKKGEWNFAAKGGHNVESHNHNDVGSFSLFYNGIPILIDLGNSTYMRQTFNPKERYTIWSMTSEYHSLPIIGGTGQKDGREFAARETSADTVALTFHTDIAGAYPTEAGVKKWTRDCALDGSGLSLCDTYELKERTAPDIEVFMARGNVSLIEPGLIRIDSYRLDRKASVSAALKFPAAMDAKLEVIPFEDPKQSGNWKDDHVTRILLSSAHDAPLSGKYEFRIGLL